MENLKNIQEWLDSVKYHSKRVDAVLKDWGKWDDEHGGDGRSAPSGVSGKDYEHHVGNGMEASNRAVSAQGRVEAQNGMRNNQLLQEHLSTLQGQHNVAADHFAQAGQRGLAAAHTSASDAIDKYRQVSGAGTLKDVMNASRSATDKTNEWAQS